MMARPPITQVYSRNQENNDSCHVSVPLDLPPPDPRETINLHIALCKDTRTFKSTYSIANFVSYDQLSSSSRSLIASLDSIFVPKTVKEALNHLGWSNAMLEEIHVLKGKSHMEFGGSTQLERNQWDVSGCSQLK
uniref:Putative ovule protein n=1 Tax=Solanum chacoense TaxID=4108 RepID=A0A0V0GLU9_SOLCH